MSAYDLFVAIFLYFYSTVDSITSFMGLTSSTFPTRSLVEGGTICRLSMCFHPMINSWNFTNDAPCRALVKKSASMCYLL